MFDSRYKLGSSENPHVQHSTLRFPRSLRPCNWSFVTGLSGDVISMPCLRARTLLKSSGGGRCSYVDRMVLMMAVRVDTPSFRRIAFK